MTDHTTSDTSNQHREHADQTTHQFTFDPKTDSVSRTLVSAIATLNNADPSELAILSDFVDPEALDRLFEPRHDGTLRDTNRRVQFRYEDYIVRVQTDGTIILSHSTESSGN